MTRARRFTRRRHSDLDDAQLPGFTDAVTVASGATGQVLRMSQPALDRKVAIKLFTGAGHDSWTRALFDHEVAVTGRLSSHPCIVTILEHGENASGEPFIVMPWFERGSLADEIARRGKLSVPETLRIGVRIAAALDHAHQLGVLHRDVKPANILLSELGQAVLADFGGALWMGRSPVLDGAHTPAYCAPEVLQGAAASPAADVWSLAATLLTALSGRPGLDPAAGLSRPDVGPDLANTIMAGLALDPAARPSPGDLAERLRQIEATLGLAVTENPALLASSTSASSAGASSASASSAGAGSAGASAAGGGGAGGSGPGAGDLGEVTVLRPATPGPRGRSRRARVLAMAGVVAGGAATGVAGLFAVQALFGPAAIASVPPAASAASVESVVQQNPRLATGLPARNPTAELVNPATVSLHWQDTNRGRLSYRILISPAPATGSDQAATATSSTTITGLEPGTTYSFSVQTGSGSGATISAAVVQRTAN